VLKALKQRADVVDKHGVITAFLAHFVVVGASYGVPGHAIGHVNKPGGGHGHVLRWAQAAGNDHLDGQRRAVGRARGAFAC
jgi:hypothetical protein